MDRTVVKLALFITLSGIWGCGQKDTAKSGPEATEPSGPVLTLDPSTAGVIKGTVTFSGPPPSLQAIDMGAAPPCLKLSTSKIPPVVVTGEHGELANVVVYLKSGLGNYQFPTPQDPVLLDQKGCMYVPRVIALMTNQQLEVRNEDPILHNIRPALKNNKSWSESQTVGGPPVKASFAQPEFASHILCNVHPWMRSYLFVFRNPYFGVTSTAGTFELANVPPGTYTVEAWQERFGTQDQTVTIGPKESKTLSFEFKPNSSGD